MVTDLSQRCLTPSVKLESSAMIEPIRFRIVMGHPMYIYKPIQTLTPLKGKGTRRRPANRRTFFSYNFHIRRSTLSFQTKTRFDDPDSRPGLGLEE
jgi:hypothetical protein